MKVWMKARGKKENCGFIEKNFFVHLYSSYCFFTLPFASVPKSVVCVAPVVAGR